MQSGLRTIVITGCNKGIGYGILEGLIDKNFKIIMACRSKARAEEARQKVCEGKQDRLDRVSILEVDLADSQTITPFVQNLKQFSPEGIDILLNNAGFAYKGDAFSEQVARDTLTINYFNTVELTE